jgi:hypothetical protein
MSKCGPSHFQVSRLSSERPIHSPLRVPTIATVSVAMPTSWVVLGL